MVSLREMMDRLFEDSFVRPWGFVASPNMADLAIDMYETKDDVVVKAALPGVDPEDVDLTISGDTLVIKGETKQENESKDQDYIRRERRYGSFVRSVTLPASLKADQAEAKFENGVLTLRIPKSEKSKPKSIKIQAKK
jgi:HSP20 family protein